MPTEQIEINDRYFLKPSKTPGAGDKAHDVYDRTGSKTGRMVFANGSEQECRDWVARNGGEQFQITKGDISVQIGDRTGKVNRADYVRAKTKDLREFGYAGLTEKDVDEQIDAILAGKKLGQGLTVIGKFMEDEIIVAGK